MLRIAKILTKSTKLAKITATIAAFGPSNFYHLAFYTESFFLLVTNFSLIKFYQLFIRENLEVWKMRLVDLMSICLVFSYAGFVRSTGFLHAAFICYPLLTEAKKNFKNSKIALKIFFR